MAEAQLRERRRKRNNDEKEEDVNEKRKDRA
jgi:hypothetical protein